jgi:hypothetical protein
MNLFLTSSSCKQNTINFPQGDLEVSLLWEGIKWYDLGSRHPDIFDIGSWYIGAEEFFGRGLVILINLGVDANYWGLLNNGKGDCYESQKYSNLHMLNY